GVGWAGGGVGGGGGWCGGERLWWGWWRWRGLGRWGGCLRGRRGFSGGVGAFRPVCVRNAPTAGVDASSLLFRSPTSAGSGGGLGALKIPGASTTIAAIAPTTARARARFLHLILVPSP